MKRLVTTSIFGTILGIVGAGTANASIVSSGFLDEKLTEMTNATTLQLDGKANQSDLTALSEKIGIDLWNTDNGNLAFDAFPFTSELFPEIYGLGGGWPSGGSDELPIIHYMVANNTDLTVPGIAGVTSSLLYGWTDKNGSLANPGLKGMFEGWTDGDYTFPGLYSVLSNEMKISSIFGASVGSLLSVGVDKFTNKEYTGPIYPLWKLSEGIDKIGNDWPFTFGMMSGLYDLVSGFYPQQISLKNTSDLAHFLFGGPLESGLYAYSPGVLNSLGEAVINVGDFDFYNTIELDGFRSLKQLTNGWTSTDGTTYLGVKDLNTKIGTLPEGITVQGMYEGWTNGDFTYPGLYYLSSDQMKFSSFFGTSVGSLLSVGVDKFTNKEYTGPIYPLWKLSQGIDQIGTLPSGNFPLVPGYDILFPALNQPPTYPTSLAELITAIYGNSETGASGLLAPIIMGIPFDSDGDGRPDDYMGLQPNYLLARSVNNIANANAAKIGTVPDGKNLAGMISETDAKIGTLPAGYDSVGAALSAIKGIAEEAKTAALAAIPDPKQEGSSGKYVLTVDIIGDNATYHWEKIDREGETTTTTE